jgi:hypothetical protein
MDEKACTNCGEVKPLDAFYLDRGKPRTNCKTCHVAARLARRASDPERAAEIDAKHYAKHREKKRAQQAEWWAKNGKARNKRVQEKHAANPEHKRALSRAWTAANPEKVSARNGKYYALYKGAEGAELIQRRDIWNRDGGICGLCRKPIEGAFDIDHILPVSLGGEHVPHNVQVAHPACNRSKRAQVDQLWMGI